MGFSICKFLRSFVHAGEGFMTFLRSEQNARIHLAAAIAVIAAGMYFRLAAWEWAAVVLSIGMVLAAELLNTAIEQLCDFVMPDRDPRIKAIKDLAAAGVVVAALAAAVVGALVFGPRLWSLLGFA